jgi:hypothetical protein
MGDLATDRLASFKQLLSYQLVAKVLGTLLVVAAVLKAHALIVAPTVGDRQHFVDLAGAACEMLIGFWLLVGLYPNWTRLLALGCFIGFLHIALYKALNAQVSCKCFGNVPVKPWYAVAIDLAAILGLLLARSPGISEQTRPTGKRLLGFSVSGVVAILAFTTLALLTVNPATNPMAQENNRTGVDAMASKAGVDIIISKIERNYESISSIEFGAKRIVEDRSVQKKETFTEKTAKGGTRTISFTPLRQLDYRFVLGPKELRRECRLQGDSWSEIVVVSQGKALQYIPADKRAWIRNSPDMELDPVDPRSLGLYPGGGGLVEWLRSVTITNLEPDPAHTTDQPVEVRGIDSAGRQVCAAFMPTINFLPTWVRYYHDDGSLYFETVFNYKKLPAADSWFVKRAVKQLYLKGVTRAPGSEDWRIRSTFTVADPIVVGHPQADDVFNPKLPSGVVLTEPSPQAGPAASRNVKVRSARPAFIPGDLQDKRVNKYFIDFKTLSTFLECDVVLLGLVVINRKRIFA